MPEHTPSSAPRATQLSQTQLEQLAQKVLRLLQEDLRREQARSGTTVRRGTLR